MRPLLPTLLLAGCIQDFPPPLHLDDSGEPDEEAEILDLSEVGAVYLGHAPGDLLGSSLASGSDLDGDGLPDVALGARGVDGEGEDQEDQGAVYLLSGPLAPEGGGDITATGLPISGQTAKGQAGWALTTGDFDGDGLHDLAIGAPRATIGPARGGRVAIFLGGQPWAASTMDEAEVQLLGPEAYGSAGRSLAFVGDATGDGLTDLLVGADGLTDPEDPERELGGAWLVPGGTESRSLDLQAFLLRGWDVSTSLGASPGAGADLDGDGVNEVILGAWRDSTLATQAGRVVLWPGPIDLDVDAASLPMLQGPAEKARLGISLATGDVDGDGHSDVLIGASGVDTEVESGGVVYIVPGGVGLSAWDQPEVSLAAAARLEGSEARMSLGTALSVGGDLEDDDSADVLVGSSGAWSGAGGAFLFTEALTGVHPTATARLGLDYGTTDAAAGEAVALGSSLFDGSAGSMLVGALLDDSAGVSAGSVAIAPTPW